jgi:hypothetical protein
VEQGNLWKHKPRKKNIEDKMRKIQEICIDVGYTEDRKKEETQMTQKWEKGCVGSQPNFLIALKSYLHPLWYYDKSLSHCASRYSSHSTTITI